MDQSFVVIGGGMTGYAAAQAIRNRIPAADIAVFSTEEDPPYKRPPLTKALWKGDSVDKAMYDAKSLNLTLNLGTTIVRIDPAEHRIVEAGGREYSYGKLLLATGGTPRRLPYGGADIIYYRTLDDYRRLRHLTNEGASFAIIGGGFIGTELAAALAMNRCTVTMIFPEETLGVRNYPADLARFVQGYFQEKNVTIASNSEVAAFRRNGNRFVLTLDRQGSLNEIVVDGVIAGIGVTPNTELARDAGLEVADGIVVDKHLKTSAPDVYAAGDVAAFDSDVLGPRVRVEHEDNARTMGRVAGQNMTGAEESYDHVPFFYSDLFDLGYEAVGKLDARLTTVSDWIEPYRTGVIYYLEEGQVRGVLLWNVWDKVDAARELIRSRRRYQSQDLIGRITAENK